MSRIIKLSVSNILRIRAVEVTPGASPLVIVAGRNEQGKSSVLNALAMALSGKNPPVQPIRTGSPKGSITLEILLETEKLKVTRTYSQTGGSSLVVEDKEGVALTSPQAKLDALTSRITFDPLEFTKQDDKAQLATLKTIVGLDFTALDADAAAKYARRTQVGRDRDSQRVKLTAIIRTPDLPAEPIVIADLTNQLREANEANEANDELREKVSEANDSVTAAEGAVQEAKKSIAHAEEQLRLAQQYHKGRAAELQTLQAARDAVKTRVESLQDVDTSAILAKIEAAGTTNELIRANQSWDTENKALMGFETAWSQLTEELEKIKREKEKALEKAKFPIEGLGFAETGVTYKGAPFKQASSAAQIRASLAIACALNPKLPVMFIREGSLLDEESLGLVKEFAEAHGAQVWVECVGTREDATVVIEDGEVMEMPEKPAAPVEKPKAKKK